MFIMSYVSINESNALHIFTKVKSYIYYQEFFFYLLQATFQNRNVQIISYSHEMQK